MNKQQFLSELNQYLTFISTEERALVMEEYHAKFDEAGDEGEAALILRLGTPMMIAIALKRRKEAGEPLTDRPAPQPKSESAENTQEPEAPAAQAEETAESEAPEDETPSEAEDLTGDGEADAAGDDEPEETGKKPKAKAGAVIACVVLGLLTVVFSLLIVGIGAYFIVIMGNLVVTALQSLTQLNNALLLFAGGFVSGGIGIVIVWLGIWTAIRIISKLVAKTRP